MARTCILAITIGILLALPSCGEEASTGPPEDTLSDGYVFPGSDSVPHDTPHAADTVLPSSDTLPGDSVGPDVPSTSDAVIVPDTPGLDTAGDTSTEVTCDECPVDHPLCVDGSCACTETTCFPGSWCDDGACTLCDTDEHCTEDCIDCLSFNRVCAPDGSGCVQCGPEVPCSAGYECVDGDCIACNTADKCGADCMPCGGTTPECVGSACVCTDDSCPTGQWCLNGACSPCDTDTHCGIDCADCTATSSPACIEGACGCEVDGHCAVGSWCNNGTCEACTDGDPLHCGATCAVCEGLTPTCVGGMCSCIDTEDCGQGYWCSSGACEPCTTPLYCGPECVACSGTTPACGADGCICEEGSCPDGQWCSEGVCTPCAGDDPLHCGDQCVVCSGELSGCAAGACVCVTGSCAAGSWCDAGACTPCADDDPLHCGVECQVCGGQTPLCTQGHCACEADSCGSGYLCSDGACDPCDTDDACGASCAPCSGAFAHCHPQGLGCVQCLEDAHCDASELCDVDYACKPKCAASGCASDLTPNGEECSSAKVVGRLDAQSGDGAFLSGDTTNDGDDDNLPSSSDCWDGNDDNFYRIYLMPGDVLSVTLSPMETSFDSIVKLYTDTSCDAGGSTPVDCYDPGGDGQPDSFTFTAGSEGWHTIVVDGRSAFDSEGDYGEYVLVVALTCSDEGCCCY